MGQIKDDFSSHSDTLRTIALRHLAYYFRSLPECRFGAPLAIPFPVVALEQHGAEIEMIDSKRWKMCSRLSLKNGQKICTHFLIFKASLSLEDFKWHISPKLNTTSTKFVEKKMNCISMIEIMKIHQRRKLICWRTYFCSFSNFSPIRHDVDIFSRLLEFTL